MNLFLLFLVNFFCWLLFHYLLSYICFKIPLSFFLKEHRLFTIAKWEKEGQLWNRLFQVKKWKKHLIDGSSIVKHSYNKSHLHGTRQEALNEFSAETKRAELTHWVLLLPAPLFFLWNPAWAAWLNVLYAVIANVPFIVTQRYNRARLERALKRQEMRKSRH
ncbi:glycosyl-4,4'-diaponeurosporenoate acyltransferase CrtO family protein [Kurthia senegalensis]|uniref:glycosyl-4,4'-diaponeurosporenoate acyltransferase CrtO family protein n=1 Tax=Kurthia senegalensis TaxID=1033740 RepID=UPI000288D33F|nr:hypothetical protein [Kurthia senegalensis]